MNKKKTPNNIEDLLSLFSETLTPADVLSAKLMAQFSNAITSERLNLNISKRFCETYKCNPIIDFPLGMWRLQFFN